MSLESSSFFGTRNLEFHAGCQVDTCHKSSLQSLSFPTFTQAKLAPHEPGSRFRRYKDARFMEHARPKSTSLRVTRFGHWPLSPFYSFLLLSHGAATGSPASAQKNHACLSAIGYVVVCAGVAVYLCSSNRIPCVSHPRVLPRKERYQSISSTCRYAVSYSRLPSCLSQVRARFQFWCVASCSQQQVGSPCLE